MKNSKSKSEIVSELLKYLKNKTKDSSELTEIAKEFKRFNETNEPYYYDIAFLLSNKLDEDSLAKDLGKIKEKMSEYWSTPSPNPYTRI